MLNPTFIVVSPFIYWDHHLYCFGKGPVQLLKDPQSIALFFNWNFQLGKCIANPLQGLLYHWASLALTFHTQDAVIARIPQNLQTATNVLGV